nr:unnamed protein product [Spirometra erinaceieuropaei]
MVWLIALPGIERCLPRQQGEAQWMGRPSTERLAPSIIANIISLALVSRAGVLSAATASSITCLLNAGLLPLFHLLLLLLLLILIASHILTAPIPRLTPTHPIATTHP